MRLNWNGDVLWKKHLPNHHDINTTPDGDLLTLNIERRIIPDVNSSVEVADERIARLSSEGDLLEALSIYDVVIKKPDISPLKPRGKKMYGGSMWVDLMHSNSVEWMHHEHLFDKDPLYGQNNVLFCQRARNRVGIIDFVKEELIWAWGVGELEGPHCASVLENGNIMIFDNGIQRGCSRVLRVDPIARKIVWSYENPAGMNKGRDLEGKHFFTQSQGSAQRLPNGNTLACMANTGEIIEVTTGGDIVWHYVSQERVEKKKGKLMRAAFVRAYRYEKSFIDELFEEHGGR